MSRSMNSKILHNPADRLSVVLVVTFLIGQVAGVLGWIGHLAVIPMLFASRWIGLVQHNQVHVPLFYRRNLNTLFGAVLYLAEGVPTCLYRIHHVKVHHRFTNTPSDWTGPFSYRGSEFPHRPVSRFVYVLTFIPRAWRRTPLILWREFPNKRGELLTELAVAALIVVGGLALGSWKGVLVFVVVPWIVAGVALPLTNWRHHDGCDFADRYRTARVNTGVMSGRVAFNIGFHSAHHARPSLHWTAIADFHRHEFSRHVPSSYLVGTVGSSIRRRMRF